MWNDRVESLSSEERRELQDARLRALVERVSEVTAALARQEHDFREQQEQLMAVEEQRYVVR